MDDVRPKIEQIGPHSAFYKPLKLSFTFFIDHKCPVMRHASVTFDPAAPSCDMPASLLTQRPRHAACQRHFRSSGPVMRHASVTFDPAASSCDMPASLSIQRPRHATCQRYFRSSAPVMRHASSLLIQRPRASGTPAKFARYGILKYPAKLRRGPQAPPAKLRRGP